MKQHLPPAIVKKYHSLSERERMLVNIASVVLLVAVFYFGCWAPIQQSLQTNKAAVKTQLELLSWVEQTANRAIQLQQSGGNKPVFRGSLPQTVNQTAARHGIAIARMQPQDSHIQVWVDKAPFNDVLAWLQQLEQSGLAIDEADLAEADQPGMIKVRRLKLSK